MKHNDVGLKLIDRYYNNQKKFHGFGSRKKMKIPSKPWLGDINIDKWRHLRMYAFANPILQADSKSSWLTVGDGSYGKDAHYLTAYVDDVLATDIADELLKEAKKANYIKKYKQENAEKLSFKENSFDYVLCKESYHHFPRPSIALYEMLRVAKKAIILIEPNDVKKRGVSWKRFWSVETLGTQVNRFEISGNYVFMISRREIEKVALGIGLPAIAFAGFDDIYFKKASDDKISENTTNFKKTKFMLWILDIFYKLGLRDRSLLVSIIFKEKPTPKITDKLRSFGYDVRILPKNPYTK